MTNLDNLRLVWQDVEFWELRRLYEAHQMVAGYTFTADEVVDMYTKANEIERWLRAESAWKYNVETWLTKEKAWHVRKGLLAHDPAYAAAEKGWLAMRGINPNLDGVNTFFDLSEILQDRYALFAKAAMA